MIELVEIPPLIERSTSNLNCYNVDAWNLYACPKEQFQNSSTFIDVNGLEQGGCFFKSLNWKSVQHWKTDGRVFNCDYANQFQSRMPDSYGSAEESLVTSDSVQGFVPVSPSLWLVPEETPCRRIQVLAPYRGQPYGLIRIVQVYWFHTGDGSSRLGYMHQCCTTLSYPSKYNTGQGYPAWYAGYSSSYNGFRSWDEVKPQPIPCQDWSTPFPGWSEWVEPFLSAFDESCVNQLTDEDRRRPADGDRTCKWTTFVDTTRETVRISPQTVRSFAYRGTIRTLQEAERLLSEYRPELDAKAFDRLNAFDGNLGLFLSKVNGMGSVTITSIAELIRSGVDVKTLSSYWLAGRYGDRLSLGGLKSLIESLDKYLAYDSNPPSYSGFVGKARKDASSSDDLFSCSAKLAVQIAVKPEALGKLADLVRLCYEWDAYPTLQNTWDAIPLSFVLDWFLNVGDIFQSIDRMVQSRYYNVECTMESVRAQSTNPWLQGLNHVVYVRRPGGPLRLGVSSVELGLPSTVNVISGLALLCG